MMTFILGDKTVESGKTHDTKPHDLYSIPRIHMGKEKTNFQKLSVLWPPQAQYDMQEICTCIHADKYTKEM